MIYPVSTTGRVGFVTTDSAGSLIAPDALPTASLYRNGSADGAVTVTVTLVSTGIYQCSWTTPSGYAAGDVLEVFISATISGVPLSFFKGQGIVDVLGSTVNTNAALAKAAAQSAATSAAQLG